MSYSPLRGRADPALRWTVDRPGGCAVQAIVSDARFAEHGVGPWLAFLSEQPTSPIVFCGFIRFDETGPEPQLLYALTAKHAGQGCWQRYV
jgi:hypothetical protein